jgi:hypothetical protein
VQTPITDGSFSEVSSITNDPKLDPFPARFCLPMRHLCRERISNEPAHRSASGAGACIHGYEWCRHSVASGTLRQRHVQNERMNGSSSGSTSSSSFISSAYLTRTRIAPTHEEARFGLRIVALL